jgi:hypothetical protein
MDVWINKGVDKEKDIWSGSTKEWIDKRVDKDLDGTRKGYG